MYFVHPQLELKDFFLILKAFFSKNQQKELKKILSFYFPQKNLYFFDMGRVAFRAILEKFELSQKEIIFPAFLCDIFFPILKEFQIKPVFVDVELETFQPSVFEIKKRISSKTKAILICHTFGLPFDVKKLKESISPFSPLIVEDCAHAFFAKLNGEFCGNLGDVAFFSLYKQFPCVRGGLLVTKESLNFEDAKKTFFSFRDFLSLANYFPFFAFFFKKFANKIAPKILRKEKSKKLCFLNKISLNLFFEFFQKEKERLFLRKDLALALKEKLEKLGFLVQRAENNVFCYFSALVPEKIKEKRDVFVKKMREKKVFVTRIWKEPLVFHKELQKEFQIFPQDFKNTFLISQRIVNFPLQNYFQKKDIEKIVKITEKVLKNLN